MIAVMIDSTTLILFRHVSHPTVLYLPGVESSRIPGESWVLEVVGLVLPASLGPAPTTLSLCRPPGAPYTTAPIPRPSTSSSFSFS